MRSFFYKKNIYFLSLIFISVGIGLQLDFYKPVIILLFLQWIFSRDFSNKIHRLKKNKFAIGLIALYSLYALSILWSANINVALNDILLKIPMLVFPIIIISNKELPKKQVSIILLAFAFSSVAINIYCLIDGMLNYLNNNQWNELYYQRLTINMHTAYQALFTCFSIAILVNCFLIYRLVKNWLIYLFVPFQLVFLLMLASRMQILLMAIIIPVFLITYFYNKKKLLIGFIYTFLIFFTLIMLAKNSSSPSLKYRYKQTMSYVENIGIENGNSDPRKIIWQKGAQLIKQNWLIGVGAGDVKSALVNKYEDMVIDDPISSFLVDSLINELEKDHQTVRYLQKKAIKNNCTYNEQLIYHAKNVLKKSNNRYLTSVKREYNFHNQYLQTFGTIGVFGFILIIYLFFMPFLRSFQKRDFLFAVFLFLVVASFFTESMLERQAGVVFVFYFYSLLIHKFNRNTPV